MKKPRVLFYDIETFPNIGYTWTKWETNVIKFIKEWEIASFAYKWQGETEVKCISRRRLSERGVTTRLHDLMNEADITIAHNGDSFDLKKARVKFLQFGLKKPVLNRSIDTKKIAKGQFSFNSNSLNDLGETLNLGKKVDTGGFDLWLGCMAGKSASWDLMEKYNKQDVELLEKIYTKLRSWMPNHPSMSLLSEREGCPVCASSRVQARGFSVSAKRRIQRFQCMDCGGWFTGKAL